MTTAAWAGVWKTLGCPHQLPTAPVPVPTAEGPWVSPSHPSPFSNVCRGVGSRPGVSHKGGAASPMPRDASSQAGPTLGTAWPTAGTSAQQPCPVFVPRPGTQGGRQPAGSPHQPVLNSTWASKKPTTGAVAAFQPCSRARIKPSRLLLRTIFTSPGYRLCTYRSRPDLRSAEERPAQS